MNWNNVMSLLIFWLNICNKLYVSLLHDLNNLSINMFIDFLCKSNLLEEI